MRVDVAFGGMVVIPLGPTLDPSLRDLPRKATLDDGTSVELRWRWFTIQAKSPTDDASRHAQSWLGPVTQWTGSAAADAQAPGLWTLTIAMPPRAEGRSLRLGSRTFLFHALPPSSRLLATPGGDWSSTVPRELRSGEAMLAAAASTPLTRWWSRLHADGLRTRIARLGTDSPSTTNAPAPDAAPDTDTFDDDVLEAWATQQEERWRWALEALAAADAALARSLVQRLTLCARIDGVLAPVTPVDDPSLESLLAALLDPRQRDADRRAAARDWLDAQPATLAWVRDDAGPLVGEDATRRAAVDISAANLTDNPAVAWAGLLADQSPSEASQALTRINARSAATMRLLCPVAEALQLPPGRLPEPIDIAAHVGDDIVLARTFAAPIAVRPPGFAIPGLVADLSAAALLAAARDPEAAQPIDARTRGMLDRDEHNRWTLRLDIDDIATREQVVRVWIGPRRDGQTPAAEVRLRPAGLEPLFATDAGVDVLATRASERWILRVIIPPSLIDENGMLRLGIERADSEGRVSWPRPMLPWQMEPGRLALDLRAWDQIGRGR
ncbi:MAG: hypothetical protein SFY96_02360 [Planctomycetota bacterium]|nr:hypothetical protein [Planctomycetota bacterium]